MDNAAPRSSAIMHTAWQQHIAIPAFNISYLPMMTPVVQALRDTGGFGLIAVARLEWTKFEAKSLAAIRETYEKVKDENHTRLHLDHVPVIDEDDQTVDYAADFAEALHLGYESIMIDGSRLALEENIRRTKEIVDMAHARDVPVEAELGAIMGHEHGPLPPYDELFTSGQGFTDPDEAKQFVEATGVDWLSVAVGSVHGAISKTRKHEKKVEARLNIEHLQRIRAATNIPLVLHGGSGIQKPYIMAAIDAGIAKINVATAIRQPYEREAATSVEKAQAAVYAATKTVICDDLEVAGSAQRLAAQGGNS